ncbi:MAG: hypothetical protein M3P52_03860, partial [Actinomycetota bacterium]|nr:hypothetical protein [Actinomycetota bacterium]
MNKQMVASVAFALALASCGSSGSPPSAEGFSDQVASVCRTIGRGIGNLDATTSLDEVRSNASEASALFEDGLNELKKLTVPSGDASFAADANDLIASFEDQLDSLDAIAKSARAGDQDAVDTRSGELTDQTGESNDLAESLDISRCQFDPVFVAAPPTTEPEVPLTLPIATVPEETIPPETVPPETTPITGNKVILSSSDLPTEPRTGGTLEGLTWTDPDGTTNFLY